MKGASLDGRQRKTAETPKISLTPKTDTDHLKPASPPKRNPWAERSSALAKKIQESSSSALPNETNRAKEDAGDKSAPIPVGYEAKGKPIEGETRSTLNSFSEDTKCRDKACQTSLALDDVKPQTALARQKRASSWAGWKNSETQTFLDQESKRTSLQASLVKECKEKGETKDMEDMAKDSQSDFAHPPSPSSFSNTSGPTFASKGSPDQSKDRISDTVSNCSSGSRKLFKAAAARANENLWNYGVGSDVHVHAESMVYAVHRQLVMEQSAWFRHYLPPPNQDGSIVHIHLPFAAGAVGPCLSYMYTSRIDVVERADRSLNAAHLPRCVLGYCAAVTLQMSGLSSHILRIVEATAADFADHFSTHYVNQNLDPKEGQALIFHLFNAFKIIHEERCYSLVRPMRLALAGVLDGILPCLVRQDTLFYMLALPSWTEHGPAISADMMEYRMLTNYPQSHGSALPTGEEQLDAIFEKTWTEAEPCLDLHRPSMTRSCETINPGRLAARGDGQRIEIRQA